MSPRKTKDNSFDVSSNECMKAISELEFHLRHGTPISEGCFCIPRRYSNIDEGYFGFFDNRPDLSGGFSWRWNHSICEKTVFLKEWGAFCSMHKWNSRLREPRKGEHPGYKLWSYEIIFPTRVLCYAPFTRIYGVWCEKGDRIPQPAIVKFELEELSFLRYFTTPDVSKELGWDT